MRNYLFLFLFFTFFIGFTVSSKHKKASNVAFRVYVDPDTGEEVKRVEVSADSYWLASRQSYWCSKSERWDDGQLNQGCQKPSLHDGRDPLEALGVKTWTFFSGDERVLRIHLARAGGG